MESVQLNHLNGGFPSPEKESCRLLLGRRENFVYQEDHSAASGGCGTGRERTYVVLPQLTGDMLNGP